MKKIFTVGSLTVDLYMKPRRQKIVETKNEKSMILPFGEKVRVDAVHELFGGGAANTAMCLSKMGMDVSVLAAVGDDGWADEVVDNLEAENIGVDLIYEIPEVPTGFSVILNSKSGERTILAYSGANHEFKKVEESVFDDCEGIHLCHMAGNSKKVFDRIRKYFTKYPEKFLSWNPGKEQLEDGIDHYKSFLPVVDILVLNLEEATEFTKKKELEKIMKEFYKRGFVGILAITNGKKGSDVTDGKKTIHVPIYRKFKKVDTLGAGDAYASTLFGAIYMGKTLEEASSMAAKNSASVVSKYGAHPGLLKLKQL